MVLVADAGRARFFEREKPGAAFVERGDLATETDLPRSHDIVTDRPGRTHDSVGPGRHAMEAPSDAHRELKRQAARTMAGTLARQLRADGFERLVIVASPAFLGDLRAELSAQVADRVAGSFPLDITKVPTHELSQRLADLVAAADIR
jgi:protein required for attachment to host cells